MEECRQSQFLSESNFLKEIHIPISSRVIHVMLIICSVLVRLWMLHALYFDFSVYVLLQPLCFREYIEATKGLAKEHQNTKIKLQDSVTTQCILYRQIQLLLKSYNQLNGRNVFVIVVVYIVSMSVVSLYIFINLAKYLGRLFTYGYSAIVLLFLGESVLGTIADIHHKSLALIENLSKFDSEICWKRKYRKYWIRLPAPIRVYLGEDNFVENGTPIVTLDFVVQRTVDLTLKTLIK